MGPIDDLIRSVDSFHIKHGGYGFSVHQVLFYLYALEQRHYARQKSHHALAPNQPWHTWSFKRNVRIIIGSGTFKGAQGSQQAFVAQSQ